MTCQCEATKAAVVAAYQEGAKNAEQRMQAEIDRLKVEVAVLQDHIREMDDRHNSLVDDLPEIRAKAIESAAKGIPCGSYSHRYLLAAAERMRNEMQEAL